MCEYPCPFIHFSFIWQLDKEQAREQVITPPFKNILYANHLWYTILHFTLNYFTLYQSVAILYPNSMSAYSISTRLQITRRNYQVHLLQENFSLSTRSAVIYKEIINIMDVRRKTTETRELFFNQSVKICPVIPFSPYIPSRPRSVYLLYSSLNLSHSPYMAYMAWPYILLVIPISEYQLTRKLIRSRGEEKKKRWYI